MGLEQLLDKPVEYNGYQIRPTEHAYRNARRVMDLARLNGFPEPEYTPDGEAGIDLEWREGARVVSVACRANAGLPDYVYHQDGSGYDARAADDEYILDRLRWLVSAPLASDTKG